MGSRFDLSVQSLNSEVQKNIERSNLGINKFEELVGLTIPCAYFAMQDSNWMSRCKFEVSESTMNRINDYKSKNKE